MSQSLRWTGGTGRMGDASKWQGGVAPKPGDGAFVRTGTVMVHGTEGHGVFVNLTDATLDLMNGDVGSLGVSALQYSVFTSATGTLNVTGVGSVADGITLSRSSGSLHAAPDTLNVALAGGSRLAVGGSTDVLNGSVLAVTGGRGSSYLNNGAIGTSGASKLTFGVTVAGHGTITDSAADTGGGSTIEFAQGVGAGQSIALNAGTLLLDKPMAFHGVITALNTTPPPASGPLSGLGDGAILLEHTHANAVWGNGSEIKLYDNGHQVVDLHFARAPFAGGSSLYLHNGADGAFSITGYAVPGAYRLPVA